MSHDRRSVLAAIGLALPFGIETRLGAAPLPVAPVPVLRLRSFEEAVREAFRAVALPPAGSVSGADGPSPCCRIEIGPSEEVLAGVQGCHNDRAFAGYPAGHLRIVRTGSGPGPIVHGVRLHVATVDVVLTRGRPGGLPGRPLDFATLPPAPTIAAGDPAAEGGSPRPAPAARQRSTGQRPGTHDAKS